MRWVPRVLVTFLASGVGTLVMAQGDPAALRSVEEWERLGLERTRQRARARIPAQEPCGQQLAVLQPGLWHRWKHGLLRSHGQEGVSRPGPDLRRELCRVGEAVPVAAREPVQGRLSGLAGDESPDGSFDPRRRIPALRELLLALRHADAPRDASDSGRVGRRRLPPPPRRTARLHREAHLRQMVESGHEPPVPLAHPHGLPLGLHRPGIVALDRRRGAQGEMRGGLLKNQSRLAQP